jgi:hypothetical protein
MGMTKDAEWLRETMHGIDRVFWDGALETLGIAIGWSRFRPVKNTIRLGCFRPSGDSIEMHAVLGCDWVPTYVVSQLIFHETIHALQIPPMKRISSGLKHGPEFRELELRHPYTARAEHWVEENIAALLAWRPTKEPA